MSALWLPALQAGSTVIFVHCRVCTLQGIRQVQQETLSEHVLVLWG